MDRSKALAPGEGKDSSGIIFIPFTARIATMTRSKAGKKTAKSSNHPTISLMSTTREQRTGLALLLIVTHLIRYLSRF